MEDKFEEIKKMWQSQKIGDLSNMDVKKVMDKILSRLVNFEKKQLRINILKIIVLSVILLQLAMFFRERIVESVVILSGFSLIIFGSIIFMLFYMKYQFKVRKLNMQQDSVSFINEAVKMLESHLVFFKKYFWIFGLLLLLAVNLLYIDVLADLEKIQRIYFHIGASAFIILSFIFGLWIRYRRHKNEYVPLINELTEIKNDFESGVDYD